ncbi:heparinase II/III family protein, partial [Flavobacterium pokkalii]
MKKKIFFFLLVSFSLSLQAQLLKQDFSSSTVVSDYVSGTPSLGQFDYISPTSGNLTTGITNGELRFDRLNPVPATTSTTVVFYRNFNLATKPKFVQLKFDFNLSGDNLLNKGSGAINIQLGNSFTASAGNYATRIGINTGANLGEYKVTSVDNIGGAPQSGVLTGKKTITFIANNSGATQTYTAPDGSIESIATGKMEFWVGTSKITNDFDIKNPTNEIDGFKILSASTVNLYGILDFDNIEMKDLLNSPVVNPPTVELPDTPTDYLVLKHPFIWASYPERQKIVDNIKKYSWASSLYSQLKSRVDAKKNTHALNPSATLNAIPPIPGLYTDRTAHTDIVASMNEASILYYLTNDVSYAQYAADILNHYMKYLVIQPVQKYQEGGPGLMFDDGWLESRTLFPRIALTYDFLYNYVNNSTNKVFDLSTSTLVQFNDTMAQTTVTNLSDIVFQSIRAPRSNHSVLAGNGNLFNLLMISDDVKREQYFNRFYSNTSESFDAYTWSLGNFTENGVWPETFSYAKGSHELMIQSMNVIDRYKPGLNLIQNNLKILDGFIGYANWYYPSGELMRFGDSDDEGDLIKGFQWILRIANRKNYPSYNQLAKENLKYFYDSSGYVPQIITDRLQYHSPLQLLWGENIEDTQIGVKPKVESSYNLVHAGIIAQRNYNTNDEVKDGLMYYTGGKAYVHTHSTGIDMELYGKGQIMGAESGSGTYGTNEHENYRTRLAAHNTVIVNGSGKRGGTNWLTKVANVNLLAAEPKSYGTPISNSFSFSTQYIDDSFNDCLQQRTNSIIRTSLTTGYYFDILRSKGKTVNNFHDYIYHNIGDDLVFKFTDNTTVPLSLSTKYTTDITGNVTGWTFFENVNSSALTDKAINAIYTLSTVNKYMNVLIPSGINREYATALAPYTKGALNGYDKKKTPVITMRKYGEAWNEPFIAVYEPTSNVQGTVKSTTTILNNNKVVGLKVVSEVNGQEIQDIILSNDEDNVNLNLPQYKVVFSGRFAIIRTIIKDQKKDVSLYIGKGNEITFEGQTLSADTDGKGFLEYTADVTPFTLPSNNFKIQLNGETCVGKNNGNIVIEAQASNSYEAKINGKTY